ncbi:hypothetical protein D9M70_652660 [compost metagenome]
MLQDGVLLENIGLSAVEKADQIGDGDPTVKNLPTNEDVQRCAQLQLAIVIEQLLDLFLGVDLGDHQPVLLERCLHLLSYRLQRR